MKPLNSTTWRHLQAAFVIVTAACLSHAKDGYELWLDYQPLKSVPGELRTLVAPQETATQKAVIEELETGLGTLPGEAPKLLAPTEDAAGELLVGTPQSLPALGELVAADDLEMLGDEGYLLRHVSGAPGPKVVIAANTDLGTLYGAFAFLRHLQSGDSLENLEQSSVPRIGHRLLNHWDNLTGTVERGQAGNSLWDWFALPDIVDPRYRDYARANASIGINGSVLTNVNANALVLTPEYLQKAAAIADVFRPYGVRVYLTARFSAPIEIGGLDTADPLDPEVAAWWAEKADEIYSYIPDFGGFLVKANSEGQPGPQDYDRNHAEGANMLAEALAPHGGLIIWRAFVYSHEVAVDRHKQAFNEFVPLDGEFLPNVVVQVKNGPIDFMPREPFHPLFGAMPGTPLALELQITQEYLGGAYHLAYLGPLFEEVLDTDTMSRGEGSTVAAIVDGSLEGHDISVIAGVSNIGDKRNWTGHPLAQANWYAFGRLAWDPALSSETIAREWTRMTFPDGKEAVEPIVGMLMESREAVVNYSMPLGLHHIMARGHHYGPGPWVEGGRVDWTSVYYHNASEDGIGFDRTETGSNALEQYTPPLQEKWRDPATIPDNLLLWFHHLPWDFKMKSGRTLWEELCLHYQAGMDTVRSWRQTWADLEGSIDDQRHSQVAALLARQEREAIEYKDACLSYFQTFSDRPFPPGVEEPEHDLEFYMNINRQLVPGDPANQ